jgi:hypothetical protein
MFDRFADAIRGVQDRVASGTAAIDARLRQEQEGDVKALHAIVDSWRQVVGRYSAVLDNAYTLVSHLAASASLDVQETRQACASVLQLITAVRTILAEAMGSLQSLHLPSMPAAGNAALDNHHDAASAGSATPEDMFHAVSLVHHAVRDTESKVKALMTSLTTSRPVFDEERVMQLQRSLQEATVDLEDAEKAAVAKRERLASARQIEQAMTVGHSGQVRAGVGLGAAHTIAPTQSFWWQAAGVPSVPSATPAAQPAAQFNAVSEHVMPWAPQTAGMPLLPQHTTGMHSLLAAATETATAERDSAAADGRVLAARKLKQLLEEQLCDARVQQVLTQLDDVCAKQTQWLENCTLLARVCERAEAALTSKYEALRVQRQDLCRHANDHLKVMGEAGTDRLLKARTDMEAILAATMGEVLGTALQRAAAAQHRRQSSLEQTGRTAVMLTAAVIPIEQQEGVAALLQAFNQAFNQLCAAHDASARLDLGFLIGNVLRQVMNVMEEPVALQSASIPC